MANRANAGDTLSGFVGADVHAVFARAGVLVDDAEPLVRSVDTHRTHRREDVRGLDATLHVREDPGLVREHPAAAIGGGEEVAVVDARAAEGQAGFAGERGSFTRGENLRGVRDGIAEARGGKRTWRSVWGSGLAAAICAAFALATGSYETFAAGFAACFASKLGDTTSSEIGKAYGTRTYLSTTFREVPRGTEGAVSLEGSLAGVAAALAMSVVSLPLGLASSPSVAALVFVSAVIANYAESILGATVQTKSEESTGIVALLTNDVVNVLQTSLASLIAVLVCGNFV